MSLIPNVMLRLDVEAMRYQIIHAFMSHSQEVQDEIGKQVDSALKDFDFAAVVKSEVDRVLREAVKSALAYACSRLMYENPIHEMIQRGAAEKVREAIENLLKKESI
jgi:hypothetical protein